jgi:hypothetical protein
MSNTIAKRWIALVALVALAGVVAFGLFAGAALAQGPLGNGWGRGPGGMMGGWGYGSAPAITGTTPYGGWQGGWGPGGMMGRGGMMGGWGYGNAITGTTCYEAWQDAGQPGGWGPGGMMGRGGMMGGWGPGPAGCPGAGGWGDPGAGAPLTMDQAAEAVEQYLAAYGSPDAQALALVEIMEFTGNFYAEVEEESTGMHAFELLVDRYTGAVYPEPGPNMMWNTKYGHMGSRWGRPDEAMTVTAEQAREDAQAWLDASMPGATAANEAEAFYGYYTLHVLQDDQVVGMLSVNGYTGQVWYHTWHGEFLGMAEYHE